MITDAQVYRTYVAELAHGRGAKARTGRHYGKTPEWARQVISRHEASRPSVAPPSVDYVESEPVTCETCQANERLLRALILDTTSYHNPTHRDDELLALVAICLTTFCALMVAWRMVPVWMPGALALFGAVGVMWTWLLQSVRVRAL